MASSRPGPWYWLTNADTIALPRTVAAFSAFPAPTSHARTAATKSGVSLRAAHDAISRHDLLSDGRSLRRRTRTQRGPSSGGGSAVGEGSPGLRIVETAIACRASGPPVSPWAARAG